MADYTKTTDFTAKDGLPAGDPAKIAKGSEVDTEFDNIQSAVGTKANKVISPIPENIIILSADGDLLDGGKGLPTGDVVGTSDTQTLTNKTLTSPTIDGATIDSTTTIDGLTKAGLIDRTNHTGTQTLSTISDAGGLAAYDYLKPGDDQLPPLTAGDAYTQAFSSGGWSTNSESWAVLKTFSNAGWHRSGTVRFSFYMYRTLDAYGQWVRLMIDGVEEGIWQITDTTPTRTVTIDIAITSSTQLELQGYTTNSSSSVVVEDVYLKTAEPPTLPFKITDNSSGLS